MSAIPRVKVCCISSLHEAQLAIGLGASALGLVGPMPSGPGVISEELIAEIAAAAPPAVSTFLLTSETRATTIINQHRRVRTSVIQLVDFIEREDLLQIRAALPGVKLVQVVHVTGPEALPQAQACASLVDAVLLDSGNPTAKVKELGGTGRVHNWEISRDICRQLSKPVFLAGGLNPQNICRAWDEVRPFGLDLCSGVRTAGKLDPQKLQQLMAALDFNYA